MKTAKGISKRGEQALDVLRAGGYFRKALEAGHMGREQFQVRLRTFDGSVVKGIGAATLRELEGAGLLSRRPCAPSSTWPQEWIAQEGPCRGCSIPEPIRSREQCEFCGGSGIVAKDVDFV